MDICIREGSAADLDSFAELLEEVRRGMDHPEWFYVDSREELRRQLDSGNMKLWLAMDGERIAGAFDLLIPGLEAYNYGYELGFSEEELLKVINMDSAAVHPDYRGLGLQRKLIQAAEDWLGREEDRILLCTIHPDNCYSLRNGLAQGYSICRQVSIYGSTRYVLQKNISKSPK